MTEELEQLLKNLQLRRILEIYDEQLRAAEKEDVTYSEFLTRLVRAQWHARQESALEWRIRRANLPERWSLETFPFARQPGVNRKQIRAFAELEFIAKAENIVLIGETARGKTGLACGLLLKALENGYRGQFIRAQDLFDEMYASLADRSTRQLLKRLARLDVLLVDELGYLNLKPEQSNIFFKLMEERYHQHSTIITTNLGLRRMAELSGQSTHGGSTAEPSAALLPHRAHQGSVAARAARLRRKAWKTIPSAGKSISKRSSRLTARHREPRARSVAPTAFWPPNCMRAACPCPPWKTPWCSPPLAASSALPHAPPLGTIRSLAYFLPVINEVLELTVSPDYFRYLRRQIAGFYSDASNPPTSR